MKHKVMKMAVLIIGLFVIGANQAVARPGINFYIHNIDFAPVTITFESGGCMYGNIPNGEIWENAPQGNVHLVLHRDQGSACDGEGGHFQLTFSPKIGIKAVEAFIFSNDGALWVTPIANHYPGNLVFNSDGSYTYTTVAREQLIASKPQGSWDKLCAGNCNEQYSEQITNETGTETTVSEETKSAISVALEAGIEFEGVGSAKTTVTASLEKSIGKSMSNRVMRSESKTKVKNVVYTPEQMSTFNIHAVWQWIAKTKLSNGQSYILRTEEITCTPDGIEPSYLPGSKEHIGACTGKNAAATEKPQDATPKPTTVETPKPTATISNRTDAEYLNLWAESNRLGLPKAVGAFQLTASQSRCPSGCEESNGHTFLFMNFYMPSVQKENITIEQIEKSLKPALLPGFCSSEAPKRNIMIGVLVQDMNKNQIGNFWVYGRECPDGN